MWRQSSVTIFALWAAKEWKMKKETRAEREIRISQILEAMDREYGTEYS